MSHTGIWGNKEVQAERRDKAGKRVAATFTRKRPV